MKDIAVLIKNFDRFYDDRAVRVMFNLLADGKWHDKVDVIAECAPYVGVSSGYRYPNSGTLDPDDSQSRTVKGARGQREAARIRLHTHTRDRRIEEDPLNPDRVRLDPEVKVAWLTYAHKRTQR